MKRREHKVYSLLTPHLDQVASRHCPGYQSMGGGVHTTSLGMWQVGENFIPRIPVLQGEKYGEEYFDKLPGMGLG